MKPAFKTAIDEDTGLESFSGVLREVFEVKAKELYSCCWEVSIKIKEAPESVMFCEMSFAGGTEQAMKLAEGAVNDFMETAERLGTNQSAKFQVDGLSRSV